MATREIEACRVAPGDHVIDKSSGCWHEVSSVVSEGKQVLISYKDALSRLGMRLPPSTLVSVRK